MCNVSVSISYGVYKIRVQLGVFRPLEIRGRKGPQIKLKKTTIFPTGLTSLITAKVLIDGGFYPSLGDKLLTLTSLSLSGTGEKKAHHCPDCHPFGY